MIHLPKKKNSPSSTLLEPLPFIAINKMYQQYMLSIFGALELAHVFPYRSRINKWQKGGPNATNVTPNVVTSRIKLHKYVFNLIDVASGRKNASSDFSLFDPFDTQIGFVLCMLWECSTFASLPNNRKHVSSKGSSTNLATRDPKLLTSPNIPYNQT